MSEIYTALEQARLRREQQLGNGTREAAVRLTYTTDGVGENTSAAALEFGCAFLDPPHVASGLVASKFPDIKLWRYPVVSTGIWKWKTQASTDPTRPLYVGAWLWVNVQCDPRIAPRSDGAELDYLVQRIDTLQADLTAASQLNASVLVAQQQAADRIKIYRDQLNEIKPGTQQYETNYHQLVDAINAQAALVAAHGGSRAEIYAAQLAAHDAEQALRLVQNPPQVGLTHHLTFSGLATQAYSLDARFREDLTPIPVQF